MDSPPARIVVLGAGVAALETAFLLHMRLHGRAELWLVSEGDKFLFSPNLVYVPFGADPGASTIRIEDVLARRQIIHVDGEVAGVDIDTGRVHLVDESELPYEHLVIGTDAITCPQEIPGLQDNAVNISDSRGVLTLQERFAHVRGRARAGALQRVVFVVPRHNRGSLPLYEVALMLHTWLRREGAREHVEIAFVTHEAAFAEACGPRMHEVVEHEFTERGIEGHAAERLIEVRAHEAIFADGRTQPFDVLVTIPPHAPGARYEGLPVDERGFLHVESETRQVRGHPEIYAPGDAGDFPLKDVFLALLQADAVADHLAAIVTSGRFSRPFDAQSMQIIDMLDSAAIAQLPLEATHDPDHPVRLRSRAEDEYKVGVSPRWRKARRLFASYLLARFATGEPFQAGPRWRLMDVGVRGMADALTDR